MRTIRATGKWGSWSISRSSRKRLIRSCIAIALGMAVGALFIDRIANFVLEQIVVYGCRPAPS